MKKITYTLVFAFIVLQSTLSAQEDNDQCVVEDLTLEQKTQLIKSAEGEHFSKLALGNIPLDISNIPDDVSLITNKAVVIDPEFDSNTQYDSTVLNAFSLYVGGVCLVKDLALGSKDLLIREPITEPEEPEEEDEGSIEDDFFVSSLPDYVFQPDYKLKSLEEVEQFVKTHKHLPDVIGKKELEEQGYYKIHPMLIGQLKNLEELVLHTIEQEKKIKEQAKEIKELRSLAASLGKKMEMIIENNQKTPTGE